MADCRQEVEVQQDLLPGNLIPSTHPVTPIQPSNKIVQAQFLLDKSTFPPPFQWIYYLASFVHWCKNSKVQVEKADRKMEYLRLLKKLIAIKQNKELEMTKEDSLRKDLKQDMKVELQNMKLEIQKILEKFEQLAKQIDKN